MRELDGATLTYAAFRDACLVPNRPAIIRNAAAAGFDLAALTTQLSPNGLCNLLGPQHRVPVYDVHNVGLTTVNSSTEKGTTAGRTTAGDMRKANTGDSGAYLCAERSLQDVLASWATNKRCIPHDQPPADDRLAYLKDWHMQSDVEAALAQRCRLTASTVTIAAATGLNSRDASARRHGFGLYSVPACLGPDWMDPFCADVVAEVGRAVSNSNGGGDDDVARVKQDAGSIKRHGFGDGRHDYRFAYIGAVNTWTGLHYDVFGTYSWSFNVCGDKLWFFPNEEGNRYLLAHLVRGFPIPPDIRVLTGFQYVSSVQHAGDLVFVPSRYFHQVHNISGRTFPFRTAASTNAYEDLSLDLTIAINHNWCNQFCIATMVDIFLSDVDTLLGFLDVADLKLIFGDDEVDAWRAHVDFLLQSGSNWGFSSVLSFLAYCMSTFGDSERDGGVQELLQGLTEKVQRKRDTLFV